MKFRPIAIGVGITILTSILLLGLIELGVRIFHPLPPFQSAKQSLELNRGQFTKPGVYLNQNREYSVQVHVNEYGFVDKEWQIPDRTSTLLIGDSFVQAAQVELSTGLGRQLEDLIQTPILSIGVPGAGTTTSFLLLKEWLPKIQPRRVLIGILLGNDVLNNHPDLESKTDKPFARLENDQLVFEYLSKESFFPTALLKYSHGLRWVEHTQNRQEQIRQKMVHTDHPLDYDVYLSSKEQSSTAWMDSWNITSALLKEIQFLCTNQQIDVYYVLFPSLEEISNQRQSELRQEYPSLEPADFLRPHNILLRELDSLNIDNKYIIDLYETFLTHPMPDSLYFSKDGHWTSSGHHLAAQSIAQHLLAQE